MNRRHLLQLLAGGIAASTLAACGRRKASEPALKADARLLALGDSLTFGYGAPPGEDWPARLAALTGWQVVNEGVNGDTSAGALKRLDALLAADSYDAVLVGIGGNDMLRGVPLQTTRDNIAAIVRQARTHTPRVALIATPAPELLRATSRALGAAPLCRDARFARAMADLPVYLRQSHAERDLAALGQIAVDERSATWVL